MRLREHGRRGELRRPGVQPAGRRDGVARLHVLQLRHRAAHLQRLARTAQRRRRPQGHPRDHAERRGHRRVRLGPGAHLLVARRRAHLHWLLLRHHVHGQRVHRRHIECQGAAGPHGQCRRTVSNPQLHRPLGNTCSSCGHPPLQRTTAHALALGCPHDQPGRRSLAAWMRSGAAPRPKL